LAMSREATSTRYASIAGGVDFYPRAEGDAIMRE
jgi:hypothetical protein